MVGHHDSFRVNYFPTNPINSYVELKHESMETSSIHVCFPFIMIFGVKPT